MAVLLAAVYCLPATVSAQSPITFQKTFGGIDYDTDSINLCFGSPVAGGGYIIASSSKSFGGTTYDLYLLRIGPSGNVIWSRTYGNTAGGGGVQDIASSVRQTADKGFIVAGEKRGSGTGMIVMKTDSVGNVKWNKSTSSLATANYAEQLKNGTSILVTGKGGNTPQDAYIMRLNDTTGQVIWHKSTGQGGTDDVGFFIDQAPGGKYVMSGHNKSGTNPFKIIYASCDSAGNIDHVNATAVPSVNIGENALRGIMRRTPDGGYILCGTVITGPGTANIFLSKRASTPPFMEVWKKEIGGSSAGDDVARSIVVTPAGDYAISGFTRSFGGGEEALLVKVKADASAVIWAKAYGGSGKDNANNVVQTPDGGYALFGETSSFGSGATDVYMIKTDSNGVSGCNERSVTLTITNANTANQQSGFGAGSTSSPTVTPTAVVNLSPAGSAGNNLCSSSPAPCNFNFTLTKNNPKCNGICNGNASVNISGTNPPFTYLWMPGNQTNQNATALCAGQQYTVTISDQTGCKAADTLTLQPPPPLTVTFTPGTTVGVCPGKSATITATVNGGTPPHTFSWSPAAGLSCTTCPNPVVTPTAGSTYTLTVSDLNACLKTAMVQVTILPAPSVTAPPKTICNGFTATLTASGGNVSGYSWSTGATTSTIFVSPTTTTPYTVTVTGSNGCTNSTTTSVTVNPIPVPGFNTTHVSCNNVCDGGITALPGPPTGPFTYSWSTSPPQTTQTITGLCAGVYTVTVTDKNGCKATRADTLQQPQPLIVNATPNNACGCNSSAIANPNGGIPPYSYSWSGTPAQTTQTATALCAGTYTVTVTDKNGCTAVRTVNISPSAASGNISPASTSICTGNSTTLSAFPAGSSYSWNTGATTSSIVVSPTTNTTYSVSIGNGACTANATATVTVTQRPAVNIAGPGTICTGTPATLNGTGTGNYSWSTGATTNSIVVSPSTPGTYSFILTIAGTGSAGGCDGKDTFFLNVAAVPQASVASTYSTICDGLSNTTLTASGGTSYTWSASPPPFFSLNDSVLVSPDVTTIYTVLVRNAAGCSSTAAYTVTVSGSLTAPTVTPLNPAICLGDSVPTFTATGTSTPVNWLDTAGNFLAFFGTNPFSPPQNLPAGTYYVICVQGWNAQCISPPTLIVGIIHPLPTANAGNDVTICAGHTANLNSSGGANYWWVPSTYLNNANVSNPSSTPDSTITYVAHVEDANTCKNADTMTVFVMFDDSCGMHIYNMLSPNGDGDNDIWWIDGINLFPENTVQIFSRWGGLVWEGTNYDNKKVSWRGQNTHNGPLPAGTYYYIVNIKERRFTGWVELLR